jgi:hypothetical protein
MRPEAAQLSAGNQGDYWCISALEAVCDVVFAILEVFLTLTF